MAEPHRKRVRHYDYPSHCHELTFSCYGRRPLLTNDTWRELLSRSIDSATDRHGFGLVAFVFMPEHVHLLVFPLHASAKISPLLKGIKQPVAHHVKQLLMQSRSSLLETLTIQERPGKQVLRFWQEGGDYDRNLYRPKAVATAIDYIHHNPVRRKLVEHIADWKWSSASALQENNGFEKPVAADPDLPKLTPLPAEFWDETSIVE